MNITKVALLCILSCSGLLVYWILEKSSKTPEIIPDDYVFIMVGSDSNYDDLVVGSTIKNEHNLREFPHVGVHPQSSYLFYEILLDGAIVKEYSNRSVMRPINVNSSQTKITIRGKSSHPVHIIAYKYINYDEHLGEGDIQIIFKNKSEKDPFLINFTSSLQKTAPPVRHKHIGNT